MHLIKTSSAKTHYFYTWENKDWSRKNSTTPGFNWSTASNVLHSRSLEWPFQQALQVDKHHFVVL